MDEKKRLRDACTSLGLTSIRNDLDTILHEADQEQCTYLEFLTRTVLGEVQYRQQKARERRVKEAGFPYAKHLADFDLKFCKALSKRQFAQLRELTWIDGLYNLILSGPPGVGKTHLAIGLGYEACEKGYKVSYTTMQSLIKSLRTEDTDRRAKAKMKRIRSSSLLIIDEVGYLPVTATEGNFFFQLISDLQEQASILITTNKGFEAWTEFLGDAALATAILDRLSYQCDRIQMNGKSYRLENRKSFFENSPDHDAK